MNTKVKVLAIVATMAFVVSSCAQQKKGIAIGNGERNKNYASLLIATEQTTLPGRPEMQPTTTQKLLVIWKSKTPPTQFFWRGNSGWLPCDVSKVSNYDIKKLVDEKNVFATGYTAEQVSLENVKMNDTLELTPTLGGKYPIPESVADNVKNTIFYKAEKTNWLTIPVEKFVERPDIIMQ
ncbi:MAG: hypothetical protein R2800_06930 [Flavipsychrobacter sp.]